MKMINKREEKKSVKNIGRNSYTQFSNFLQFFFGIELRVSYGWKIRMINYNIDLAFIFIRSFNPRKQILQLNPHYNLRSWWYLFSLNRALANTQLSHIGISKEVISHRKTKFIIFTHPQPHYTAAPAFQLWDTSQHRGYNFPRNTENVEKWDLSLAKWRKWDEKRSQRIFHPIWIYRKIHSAKR